MAFKPRSSIWLGDALAIMTDQGIFKSLQIGVPRVVDMVMTGAVLGPGVGPRHALVDGVDSVKRALQNFGSGVANATQ